MKVEDIVSNMLNSRILGTDQFLIKVQLSGAPSGRQKLLVVVDSIKGIGIDECANISRSLSEFLEAEELMENSYHLEVTSPGADAYFTDSRQYLKNIGRQVQIILQDQETLTGLLKEATDQHINIELTKKVKGSKATTEEVVVPISDIQKAKVVISF